MYNLKTHTSLPVGPRGVPWGWVMYWSSILEADLEKRRLQARVRAGEAARKGRRR